MVITNFIIMRVVKGTGSALTTELVQRMIWINNYDWFITESKGDLAFRDLNNLPSNLSDAERDKYREKLGILEQPAVDKSDNKALAYHIMFLICFGALKRMGASESVLRSFQDDYEARYRKWGLDLKTISIHVRDYKIGFQVPVKGSLNEIRSHTRSLCNQFLTLSRKCGINTSWPLIISLRESSKTPTILDGGDKILLEDIDFNSEAANIVYLDTATPNMVDSIGGFYHDSKYQQLRVGSFSFIVPVGYEPQRSNLLNSAYQWPVIFDLMREAIICNAIVDDRRMIKEDLDDRSKKTRVAYKRSLNGWLIRKVDNNDDPRFPLIYLDFSGKTSFNTISKLILQQPYAVHWIIYLAFRMLANMGNPSSPNNSLYLFSHYKKISQRIFLLSRMGGVPSELNINDIEYFLRLGRRRGPHRAHDLLDKLIANGISGDILIKLVSDDGIPVEIKKT